MVIQSAVIPVCYCKVLKMDPSATVSKEGPKMERPSSSMEGRPLSSLRERPISSAANELPLSSDFPETSNEKNIESDKKLRPLSRRGVKESRQQPDMSAKKAERPMSRSNSVASLPNNTNAWRPPSSLGNRLQGTASRLASAISQQTGASVSLSVLPSRTGTLFNATDRLVTQQGLSRARSSVASRKGLGTRLIQDKRYYEGILQVKMRQISNEINRLRKEIEDTNKEHATFLVYDKQVKQHATELTELQGKLADYNICLDKINMGTDIKLIENECDAIQKSNEVEQIKLENTFAERTRIEQHISEMQTEIEKEKYSADRLVQEMPIEMREKYASLCDSNVEIEEIIDKMQREMNSIIEEKTFLRQKIFDSPVKLEACELQLKILELEDMKNVLLQENDNSRNKYALQVKDNKAEIESIQRATNKLKEDIEYMKKELENIERDIDEYHGDRYQKYLELRKREETMIEFLSAFEENKNQELKRMKALKSDIARSLFRLSKHLLTMPASQAEYDLLSKEIPSQMDSNVSSKDLLRLQYQQRKLYYQKLETMEKKLITETNNLKEQIEKMRSDLTIFGNLDALKEQSEQKRAELLTSKREFLEVKDTILEEFKMAEMECNEIQRKLKENETHTQLQALERKLGQVEQNNSTLQQFIEEKKRDVDYVEIKEKTLQAVNEYNQMLISKYTGRALVM